MNIGKRFHDVWSRILPAIERRLPALKPTAMCVGAQKSGTTALFHYLSCHPRVARSKVKEINFFNCNARYARGVGFYHSHFPPRSQANRRKVTFDVTPGYLGGAERAAKRIWDYDPKMRLIALLRNPISRAHSAWQMYRRRYASNPKFFFEWSQSCNPDFPPDYFLKRPESFGQDFYSDLANEIEAIQNGRIIEMPILRLGMYHQFLNVYFELFPPDQILVVSSELLKQDTAAQLSRIAAFVELEPHGWEQTDLSPRFVGNYEEKIPKNAESMLRSFYCEPNIALFELLQQEFAWD